MAGEWRPKQFGDCARLIREAVAPSEALGYPYIGLEHIGEGTLSLSGHATAETVVSTKSRFRAGDILFGKLRPYFRKVIRAPYDGICSTDIWVVRPAHGVDAGFLFYWMASDDFVQLSMRGSEGTRMPRAKWDFVARTRRLVPPLPEQRAIAHVLGTLDDKIELNRRMNATLEAMAQALFKSWFVDFDPVRCRMAASPSGSPASAVRAKAEGRDPGLPPDLAALFPDRLVDSELGEIPEGWRTWPLDRIADFLNGLALQKYPRTSERYLPAIKIAELRRGITNATDRVSADLPEKYVVRDGDVLFSWSGSLDVVVWSGGDGAMNQHLFKVTSKEYPKWFFYHWVKHHIADFRAIAAGKATTMGHIQRHHLSQALCVAPPATLLAQADNVLGPLLDKQILTNTHCRALAALRDTLLPKLLSGELRVGEARNLAEGAL